MTAMLHPLIGEVQAHGKLAKKTIIFCKSYADLIEVTSTLVTELHDCDCLLVESSDGSKQPVCEMYSASTAEDVKDAVLQSFTDPTGHVCIVVARRQQLMKEFDASDIVERPEPIHKCCDICEQNCTCKDCRVVYPLTEYEVSQTVAVDVDDYTASPTKKRRRKKHPELHTMLIEYRNSLCNFMDENGRQLPLLIGVEIASGIPNAVIHHIVEEADNISSVDDVIERGVMFRAHAQHIFEIIKSFV